MLKESNTDKVVLIWGSYSIAKRIILSSYQGVCLVGLVIGAVGGIIGAVSLLDKLFS